MARRRHLTRRRLPRLHVRPETSCERGNRYLDRAVLVPTIQRSDLAELEIPVPIPLLRPVVTPGGDLVFQEGLVERQAMLDVTLGVLRPLYLGGGPAVLSSVFRCAPLGARPVAPRSQSAVQGDWRHHHGTA